MDHLIYDRVEFEERLDAELSFAFRHGTSFGVLLLLPDDVRPGDRRRQRAFAERLSEMLRREDAIALLDDRTWAVLVREPSPPALRQLAERLCGLFQKRARMFSREASFSVSIGVALAEPSRENESVEALLERARLALERARSTGGGRVKA
jgi:GGDEF domain-containing protein